MDACDVTEWGAWVGGGLGVGGGGLGREVGYLTELPFFALPPCALSKGTMSTEGNSSTFDVGFTWCGHHKSRPKTCPISAVKFIEKYCAGHLNGCAGSFSVVLPPTNQQDPKCKQKSFLLTSEEFP